MRFRTDREEPSEQAAIGGRARWDGKISGASGRPTFSGHIHGDNVRYGTFAFDSLDGDMSYSAEEIRLIHLRAKHGALDSSIDADFSLTDWGFSPEDEWSADASLEGVLPLDAIQHLFGSFYPVHGRPDGADSWARDAKKT